MSVAFIGRQLLICFKNNKPTSSLIGSRSRLTKKYFIREALGARQPDRQTWYRWRAEINSCKVFVTKKCIWKKKPPKFSNLFIVSDSYSVKNVTSNRLELLFSYANPQLCSHSMQSLHWNWFLLNDRSWIRLSIDDWLFSIVESIATTTYLFFLFPYRQSRVQFGVEFPASWSQHDGTQYAKQVNQIKSFNQLPNLY